MNEEFLTQFQVIVSGMQNLQQYQAAINALNAAIQKNIAASNAQSAASRAVAASAQAVLASQQKSLATIGLTATAANTAALSTTYLHQSMTNLATGLNTTTAAAGRTLNILQLITRVAIGSVVARSFYAIAGAISSGISDAIEFQIRLSEIRTISQDAQQSFAGWGASVRTLSDYFGKDLLDTAEGFYQTISNQVAKGTQATYFMIEAQQFAVISVASTADSVELLTSAINSYNLSIAESDELSAQFFKTIELGRLRAEDISNSIGRILPIADQLGIDISEVNGMLATFTNQGVTSSEAITYIRNVILKLLNPTKEMTDLFKEVGATSGAQLIKTLGGIGNTMQFLFERAEKTADPMAELTQLFGRLRAILGAAGLRSSFAKFEDFTKQILDAGESAKVAGQIMEESAGRLIQKELTQLKNFFVVDLGQGFLEATKAFDQGIVDVSDSVAFLTKRLLELTGIIIAAFAISKVNAFATACQIAATQSLATTAALQTTTVATTGLGVALQRVGTGLVSFASSPLVIFAAITAAAYYMTTTIMGSFESIKGAGEEAFVAVQLEQHNFVVAAINANNEIINSTIKATETISQTYSKMFSELNAQFNALANKQKEQLATSDLLFDAEMAQANPAEQLNLLLTKYRDLKAQAQTYRAAGDWENSVKATRELLGLVQKIQDLKKVAAPVPSGVIEIRGGGMKQYYYDTINLAKQLRAEVIGMAKDMDKAALAGGNAKLLPTNVIEEGLKTVQSLNTAIDESKTKLENAKKAADDLMTKSADAFAQSVAQIKAISDQVQLVRPSTEYVTAAGVPMPKQLTEKETQLIGLIDQYNAAKARALEASTKYTPENVVIMQKAALDMRGAVEAIQKIDPSYLRKGLSEVVNQFYFAAIYSESTASNAKAMTSNLQTTQMGLLAIMQEQRAMQVALDKYMATIQASSGNSQVAVENLKSAIAALKSQIQDAILLLDQLAVMRASTQRFGGPVKRFSSGGSVGEDTVSAMLAPGEFVINAASAKKFFPQLVDINRNRNLNSGGPVNNFGDINVTVSNTNNENGARDIAIAIKRELKRRTVSF